jgi:peptide/nickel transport system substrate-binding protein
MTPPSRRRRLRRLRRWLTNATLPLLIALLWASCPSTTPPPPPNGLTILLDAAPRGLDPRFTTSDYSVKLSRLLFSSLITIDNDTGLPEPELAASISNPDPLRYTFTLRDARWHDGRPVTSEDVRYTFMELAALRSPFVGLTDRIARFEIHDTKSFTLHLKEPHAPFLGNLTLGIVPAHAVNDKGLLPEDRLIGSGPYRLGRRQGDAWTELLPFDDHYDGAPTSGPLIFRVVPDDNTRTLTLMAGDAHMALNATNPLLLPVLQDDPDLRVETTPSFKYTYLAFNLEHPLLRDLRVRQAIALSIDRQEIIDHKLRGTARLATGLLSPTHWAYNPDVTQWHPDLDRARRLLDDAGFPDPDGDGPQMRLWITWKTTTNKLRRAIAEVFALQLARVGIGVKVQAYEWGTFFDDIKSRNFEICSLQWPSVTDPDLYAWIFHSRSIPTPENRGAGANRGAYRNAALDPLLDEARAEHDPDRRRALYARVQQLVADDLPYISLWHEDNLLVRSHRLHNFHVLPNARLRHLTQARLAPPPAPPPAGVTTPATPSMNGGGRRGR